ncbi:HflC protein [Halorhodospira halochloris]|uniref:Protein HflC n=1 Tax=Halorhodospira halochloris TaxID=1052 RepID=A0A0X8X7W3_HALHR|nr:protease modulator HflC [Halorhodospira halochloris]MBK1651541.1 HflC protein [Halorhodospira halochloris]MCG5548752.1 protease modulator HflC [Halorhodospira halochloris]BAU57194.1 HflC protein [Halorhodospira halochloris]
MSKILQNVVLPLVLVVAVLAYFSMFTVSEKELALKFRLGEVVESDYDPGLHFKLPFVNNVRKFDARVQNLDESPERFLTSEKKNLIVDSFVKWRIADAERFYMTVRGDPERANQRLREIIRDGLRAEFGKRMVQDIISGERVEIMQILREATADAAQNLGLEVLDVRLKRIDLPEDVTDSIFERMVADRERVAREIRARGDEAGERIRADADRQRTVILAEAYREGESLRGEGDAEAADIYAQSYGQEPEFFAFQRSLRSYRQAFESGDDFFVLSPTSEFFRYFGGGGIPATDELQE